METFIGCSGFHYDHWEGRFYPDDLSTDEWLPFYAEHFNTVEINNSFYSLPKDIKVKHWYDQTPDDFRFAMKASRYITHMKKLVDDKETREAVKRFYDSVEQLEEKLGAILFQLPGNQHRDDEKLDTFCKMLSNDFTNVIEFRHNSWFNEDVLKILQKHDVSFCIISAPGDLPELSKLTTDTAYIRFYGKTDWYNYHYSKEELSDWAKRIKGLQAQTAYAYFNNDAEAYSIENAEKMRSILEKSVDI